MAAVPSRRGPGGSARRTRQTARLRLTLLYSGTFLLLGTALIAVTFLLASSGSTVRVTPGESVVAHAVPSASAGLPTPLVAGARLQAAGGTLRSVVASQRSSDLARLLTVSWLALALIAVASAGLGWIAAGRVLRPLRTMTSTARTISAGNLSERLALSGPEDEFKRLGDTLDDLLGRLQAAFEAQRRFVANASHELRTPLTVERTLLQVALADPDASAETLRATCEDVLAAGRDHERLLEALLTLASSESGLDHREPVDLAAAAGRAIAWAGPESERRAVEIDSALAPAPVAGDPALVERLIANLLDNGIRYNRSGGRVEVSVSATAECANVTVSNTGPAVAETDMARLFEPFQRVGVTRGTDGHFGLGLSIVQAIATAHRATVGARPRPGGGLCVTVSFPIAVTQLVGR